LHRIFLSLSTRKEKKSFFSSLLQLYYHKTPSKKRLCDNMHASKDKMHNKERKVATSSKESRYFKEIFIQHELHKKITSMCIED